MPVVGIGMAGDNRRRRDELLEGESIMRCSQDVQRTAWLLVLAAPVARERHWALGVSVLMVD